MIEGGLRTFRAKIAYSHLIRKVSKFCVSCEYVLLMPLAETIKEVVSLILKGVDLIDHTSIFLLRTINHYVILIVCTLS